MKKVLAGFLMALIFSCSETNYPDDILILITQPVTELTTEGGIFNASVRSYGPHRANIIRYGFCWAKHKPTISDEIVYSKDPLSGSVFSAAVTAAFGYQKFRVRFFIETDKMVFYGNEQEFGLEYDNAPVSKGMPVIYDLQPRRGFEGTEVTIYGENFVPPAAIIIAGVNSLISVKSVDPSEIKFLAPVFPNGEPFQVKIAIAYPKGDTVIACPTPFIFIMPELKAIDNVMVKKGSVVGITGENFSSEFTYSIIFSSSTGQEFTAQTKRISDSRLEVTVPNIASQAYSLRLSAFRVDKPIKASPRLLSATVIE